jgi:hypothetical protein
MMNMMKQIQKQFGHVKVITGALQDEVTSAVIRSITDIQREQGEAEALKVAQLFSKAISLYEDGVTLASALLVVAELNKDKKSAAKILGFTAISLASVLPYVLINQEQFEDFVDDLREDAKKESGRNKTLRTAKVTRLKTRLRTARKKS